MTRTAPLNYYQYSILLRAGFNFSELVDFIFGIIGVDVMDDDYDCNSNLAQLDQREIKKLQGSENAKEQRTLDLEEANLKAGITQKSKFATKDFTNISACYVFNYCLNFEKTTEKNCKENQIFRNAQLFETMQCHSLKKIIAYCQFPNLEKAYFSDGQFWTTAEAKIDCKKEKGTFIE
jgi:hypothetical protein